MGGKRKRGTSKVHKYKISPLDGISRLPDDILHLVLSMLTMQESARTSILSRRWRCLWKTSVASSSILNLDVVAMTGGHYSDDMLRGTHFTTQTHKFLSFVQQILRLDHSPVKDSCRLRFKLGNRQAHLIHQFIIFALAKRCRNLEIDLSAFENPSSLRDIEDAYAFPPRCPSTHEFVPTVKSLSLKDCHLLSLGFSHPNIFASLVDLRLERVFIDNSQLSTIFSCCPDLQSLTLIDCHQRPNLTISAQSSKLKCLTIFHNDLRKIKIDANNLTGFHYWGAPISIEFLNVPQLTHVAILSSCFDDLLNLSTDIPQIQFLSLRAGASKYEKIPEQLSIFANLKKLVLQIFILVGEPSPWLFVRFLRASPHLHRLDLHVYVNHDHGIRSTERPPDFHHPHLEEIMLSGFEGHVIEMEIAKYFIKNATSLKKIISFRDRVRLDGFSGDLSEETKEEIKRNKSEEAGMWEPLVKAARRGVEFIICGWQCKDSRKIVMKIKKFYSQGGAIIFL